MELKIQRGGSFWAFSPSALQPVLKPLASLFCWKGTKTTISCKIVIRYSARNGVKILLRAK